MMQMPLNLSDFVLHPHPVRRLWSSSSSAKGSQVISTSLAPSAPLYFSTTSFRGPHSLRPRSRHTIGFKRQLCLHVIPRVATCKTLDKQLRPHLPQAFKRGGGTNLVTRYHGPIDSSSPYDTVPSLIAYHSTCYRLAIPCYSS